MSQHVLIQSESERTAAKHLSTPVSFTGGYHLIRPLASRGWLAAIGAGTLMVLWWVLVSLLFYCLLCCIPFLWIGWLIFTQGRRHRIRAARLALTAPAAVVPRYGGFDSYPPQAGR